MRRSARSLLLVIAALAAAPRCPALPSQPGQDRPAVVNPARIVQVAATVRFVRDRVAQQGPAVAKAAQLRETCATLGALGFKVPTIERLSPDISNVELATAILTGTAPLARPASAPGARTGGRPVPGQPTDPSLPEFFVDGTADDDVVTNAAVRPTVIAMAPPTLAPSNDREAPAAAQAPAPAPTPAAVPAAKPALAPAAPRAAAPKPVPVTPPASAPAAAPRLTVAMLEATLAPSCVPAPTSEAATASAEPPLVLKVRTLLAAREAERAKAPRTPAASLSHAKEVMERLRSGRTPQPAPALAAAVTPPASEPLFELASAEPTPAPAPVPAAAAPAAPLAPTPEPVFDVAAPDTSLVVERQLPAPEPTLATPPAPEPAPEVTPAPAPAAAPRHVFAAAAATDPALHAAVAALLRRLHDEAKRLASGAPLPLNAAVLASWQGLGLPAPATVPADLEALPPAHLAAAVLGDLDEAGRRTLRDDLRLLFPGDARGL